MNILVLTSVYPQPDDDVETTATVQYFSKEWSKAGHSVVVFHNASRFPWLFYHLPKVIKRVIEKKYQIAIPGIESTKRLVRDDCGIKVFRKSLLKFIPHSRFSKLQINKQTKFIIREIEKIGFAPDLIISHWANPQIQLIDSIKKVHLYKHIAASVVFHNDFKTSDIKRYKIKKYLGSIDAVGCRNIYNSETIMLNTGIQTRPFVCYSGIPNEFVKSVSFEKLLTKKTEQTVLYVGRIVKYKNVDKIIEAIKQKGCEDYHLTIVGDGDLFAETKNMVIEYGISNRVDFTMRIPRKKVFDYMLQSECFVLISDNEVFGMVYLEAMLSGCITIASKKSALDGIIKNGENGFLCTAGDYQELSSILMKIKQMSNEEKKNIMYNAHLTAKQFSDEMVASRYLNDVLEMAKKKKWEK